MEFTSVNWSTKSLNHVVNKIVLGCMVYFIWQERNFRLFQKKYRNVHQLVLIITEVVRMKILGLKIRGNSRVFNTLRQWNISWNLPSFHYRSNELVVHAEI